MASRYVLCALVVVAFVATGVTADKGKGKKMEMMGVARCLTEESMKTIMETNNATMEACRAELSPAPNVTTETTEEATSRRPTRERKHMKPNMCFLECMWKKGGLVKDGSFVIEDYASANVKPEHQEQFKSKFNACLNKKGLPTTYTVSKDDQCKALEKYGKCLFKASMVCKVKDSSSSSSSSEED